MDHAQARKTKRLDVLGEGKDWRAEAAAERQKVEAIRQEKLDALLKAGVPQKYTAELRKLKV